MSTSTRTANRPKSVLLSILLSFFVVLSLPAYAETLDLKKVPKLKEYAAPNAEEFKKVTRVEKEVLPYNDDYISYEFRIPKKWTGNSELPELKGVDGAQGLSVNVLGILGKYVGAPNNLLRSRIIVEAQDLGYEISAKNWFVNFVLKNGFTLSGFTEHSRSKLEALYVEVQDDQPYVVRTLVLINGPRLIMFRYFLPQENYESEKLGQAQVTSSFKLLNPVNESIEKQKEFGFLDQSYFNYPISWDFAAKPIYSIERMSATMMQKNEKDSPQVLEGQIKLHVISRLLKTTIAEETTKFRDSVKIDNYTIGKFIENLDFAYDKSIRDGKTQVYELVPSDPVSMKSYEFVVSIMQGDDFYYITSLITPSREQDFYNWSRNIEAFRVVTESVRRSNIKIPDIDVKDPYYDYMKEAQ